MLPKLAVQRGSQRVLAVGLATSPVMIAFFAGRTDEEIEADVAKAIRRDGGKRGPAGRCQQLVESIGIAPEYAEAAAAVINAHLGQRVASMRAAVVATVNELRRRRAVAAGKNPAEVKCLQAREAE